MHLTEGRQPEGLSEYTHTHRLIHYVPGLRRGYSETSSDCNTCPYVDIPQRPLLERIQKTILL